MDDLQTRKSPAATGLGLRTTHSSHDLTATAPDVESLILSRLEKVRKCGKGWIAKCPAHEDRSASLSVSIGDDGRVLINDFGGCHVTAVLDAMSLKLSDLFPKRLADVSPQARKALQEYAKQSRWRAALNALAFESRIVVICGGDLLRNDLSPEDLDRAKVALDRIEAARQVLT